MRWIPVLNRERNLPLLFGTVCWVYSEDTGRCSAAVYSEDGWRCHGQEHFYVPGVTKYIVLPTK